MIERFKFTGTVRDAFERAFAPIPKEAVVGWVALCGPECEYCGMTHRQHEPCFHYDGENYFYHESKVRGYWAPRDGWAIELYFVNIADRDANAFRGFFGQEYDWVLDGEK